MSHRRSILGWIDRAVQNKAEQMASRYSRRSFLGKVGVGASLIAGAKLLVDPNAAEGVCTLPTGCFGTVDVNVCYSPWVVVAAEAGQSGVVLRKGPWFGADPVTH